MDGQRQNLMHRSLIGGGGHKKLAEKLTAGLDGHMIIVKQHSLQTLNVNMITYMGI